MLQEETVSEGNAYTSAPGIRSMTRPQLKEFAKKLLSGNWGIFVLITLVYWLCTVAVSMIPAPLLFLFPQANLLFESLNWIISILLIPLSIGLMAVFKNFVDGKEQTVANLFDLYKDFEFALKLIGAMVLYGIAVVLGLLLFLVPGIIIALGFAQVVYIMLDNRGIGIIDAFKKSWAMMDGYKGEYFVLNLSFLGWAILAMFTCGIGFLWLFPYMYVAYYLFYLKIKPV